MTVHIHIASLKNISYEKVVEYLNGGQYEMIENALSGEGGRDIVKRVEMEISERLHKVNDIEEKYIHVKDIVKVVVPAVTWTENARYVYLQILYKEFHIQDDVMCGNVDLEYFELLTDSNYIHFSGYCFNTSKDNSVIKFELELLLKSNLNQLKSLSHNITPNIRGVYTVLLYKSENMYWGSLLKYSNATNVDIIKIDESVFDTVN